MSVITTHNHVLCAGNAHCTLCGEHLHPPYVTWHAFADLFFCTDCCLRLKDGLHADLVQVSAITEIRKFYPNVTLERVYLGRGISTTQ